MRCERPGGFAGRAVADLDGVDGSPHGTGEQSSRLIRIVAGDLPLDSSRLRGIKIPVPFDILRETSSSGWRGW